MGKFWLDGRMEQAHRVAFFLTFGRWPEPCGLHTCDNPPCCNPAHLWEGTKTDNSADKVAKGRQSKGEQHGCVKLNEARVEWARARYAAGGVTQQWIADVLGVSNQQISNIVGRRQRK